MSISGKAKLAGIMGWPVSHSRSPRLHGHWLARYGIDGAYVPLPVRPDDLADAFRILPRVGFRGWSVTIPHKEAALGLCGRVEPAARRIGAVNTVVVAEDGTLAGSNTDVYGFMQHLQQECPAFSAASGPAVVLGAGGAARAILAGLLDAGCPRILLANRSRARAEALAAELGGAIGAIDWEGRERALEGAALLVNTTSLGMQGQPPLEISLDALPRGAIVNDIVYAPLETALLAQARARGNAVVDGLGMLLHQGRPAFAAWYGRDPEVDQALRQDVAADLLGR